MYYEQEIDADRESYVVGAGSNPIGDFHTFLIFYFAKYEFSKIIFSLDNQHGYPIFSLVVSFHYYLTDMSDVYV